MGGAHAHGGCPRRAPCARAIARTACDRRDDDAATNIATRHQGSVNSPTTRRALFAQETRSNRVSVPTPSASPRRVPGRQPITRPTASASFDDPPPSPIHATAQPASSGCAQQRARGSTCARINVRALPCDGAARGGPVRAMSRQCSSGTVRVLRVRHGAAHVMSAEDSCPRGGGRSHMHAIVAHA